MSKILITGGTGFIGRHLVPYLQAMGHDIGCAVWFQVPSLNARQIIVKRLEANIDWSSALQGIEIVIHLAARVHIFDKQDAVYTSDFIKINSTATKNFAEQAAQAGVKRFIFLSSIKVNGESTPLLEPFIDAGSEEPADEYSKSKFFAEQHLKTISNSTGLEVVILRPPLVYGPGVKANFKFMLDRVNQGWPLPFANIRNKRTFIFIDNLISAIDAVLINSKAPGNCFLVADNESWALPDLLREIAEAMGKKLYLLPMPVTVLSSLFKLLRLNNLNTRLFGSLCVSNQRIQQILGWTPPIRSKEGLNRTVEWYQQEKQNNPID